MTEQFVNTMLKAEGYFKNTMCKFLTYLLEYDNYIEKK